MALSENARKVFDYVKSVNGANITAADISEATGIPTRSVNPIVTAAFARKDPPLMERVEAEIENPDGTHKQVKFIKLTDAGLAFDPDATPEK